jgi:hypothetical protein
MMERHHEDANTFIRLILTIFQLNGQLIEAGDRLCAPVGLSSARWQVLGVVEHGPAPVAQVARVMGLARQSVQQTADALERDGLIEYRANPPPATPRVSSAQGWPWDSSGRTRSRACWRIASSASRPPNLVRTSSVRCSSRPLR